VEAQPFPVTDVDTVLFVGRTEDHDAHSARFEEATHTWTVGGRCARVLIASDGELPAHVRRADDLEPYLGLALHGVPNYFLLTGPDTAAQKGYIAKCLAYLADTESTRIEVRASTQRYYNERSSGRVRRRGHYWRRVAKRIPSAFEVSSLHDEYDAGDAIYDGPATVEFEGRSHDTRMRLAGRIDPVDGHYHWQGTVFDADFEVQLPQQVMVTLGGRRAAARLAERTPQSTYSVVGVGAPPFQLSEVEVEIPLL
jgi:hypothetical protein